MYCDCGKMKTVNAYFGDMECLDCDYVDCVDCGRNYFIHSGCVCELDSEPNNEKIAENIE